MTRVYVDIHILQDIPPSNINRDDNGTPKQAVYGGVQRLRVSSQAWKRATRKHFENRLGKDELGVRTRRLRAYLGGLLLERGLSEDVAYQRADQVLDSLKLKAGKKETESQYLLFAGRHQLRELADELAAADDVKKVDAAGILGSLHSLDVALFGRMVADMTKLNVDAAAQVAHAISTHATQTQFDYFTAVDDEQEKDEAGAGMIGLVEFDSATMYRFATVGLEQLVDNIGDRESAVEGVGEFVRSFALSMPTGHQTTFAPRTRPALVAVVVREDQPVNFVSAFEAPVRARAAGYMGESQNALAKLVVEETARWGDEPLLVAATYHGSEGSSADELRSAFGESRPLDEVIEAVTTELRRVSDE